MRCLNDVLIVGFGILFIFVVAAIVGANQKKDTYSYTGRKVQWLGWVVCAESRGIDINFTCDKTKEIGLRKDGVVVWRNVVAYSGRGD